MALGLFGKKKNNKRKFMRDITKNRLMKIIYVLIVIGAFWLGHHYGEKAAQVINELPIPKVSIEMPSGKNTQ